ncbi:hypothetical protein DLJ59_26915 [Micromonospora inaquosa]|uniref:Uncharacterized protein n=1 Tax=Micromonospora inaquosa TaxID=2203716 RepID=A0A3N9WCI5_9ACTN|nr:hypothetical protein DLJ59_26915 [Micromonospora inaquosa]
MSRPAVARHRARGRRPRPPGEWWGRPAPAPRGRCACRGSARRNSTSRPAGSNPRCPALSW